MRRQNSFFRRWTDSIVPFVFFTLLTCSASAQVDPAIEWKRMRLPHFDLIYDAKHQELANLYADRLENNLVFLKEYFEFFPERTVVVLNDRTDLTNGYATPIPYRTIMVYPVLPGPQETISDFGDWARELTLHEYTHILSFEPRRGIVKGLYYTFGNIITPNILLPRWWLEGVAVDLETRTSEKGRLRSPYQDAAIRAYVNEQKWDDLNLAEINEAGIHTWPQGARPYLLGSLMWSEMISRHGTKLIAELHQRYGGRMPYFLEGPVQDLMNTSYEGIFLEMKESFRAKAQNQISALRTLPFTQGPTLSLKNSIENFSPLISPDGLKMILLSKNEANKRSVRILKRPSTDVPFDGSQEWAEINQRLGESSQDATPVPRAFGQGILENPADEDAPPGGTIQRLSWFPDSKRFVFDKLDTVNKFQESTDLYVFDLARMKIDRITRGERAREAGVSPQGTQLAFVKLDAGRTHLATFDLEAKKSEVVYSPPLQVRISAPTYLSEREIVFSERDQDGREHLKVFSLESKSARAVLTDFPDSRSPRLTARGLIFSSYRNGTGNIYLANQDLSAARPLTHTPTLISSSSLDDARNELYVSELTASGFQVRHVSLSALASSPGELPRIAPLLEDRYPVVKANIPVMEKPEPEDYSVWPYLWPHYWLPNVYFGSDRTVLGGSVASADPLGKHAYSLEAVYDTQPKDLSSNFLYSNNQTSATVLAKGLDYQTTLINQGYEYRHRHYEFDALWEVTPLSTDLYAGFGYGWLSREFLKTRSEFHGPSLLANYSDLAMSGAQISPESGQTMTFSATEFSPGNSWSGAQFHLLEASVQKYHSRWLPRRHAILLRAQGQFIDRNEDELSALNNAFTLSYLPFANSPIPLYVMRGYLHGQFWGKSLANYSFEYRFPIAYLYRGNGTLPVFVRRVHGAFIADGLTIDGFSYDREAQTYERVPLWKSFWSTGAELKVDLTLGYHFPVTFFVGFYNPLDSHFRSGDQVVFGLQL